MTGSWRLVVVALAALSCVLPGASAIAQNNTDLFVQGIESFQRGEYDQAIEDLEKVVAEHPDWEAAWYYLGVARFQLASRSLAVRTDPTARDFTAARDALNKAVDIAPSRPGARLHLGRIYEQEGKLAQAMELYRQELSLKRLVDRNSVQVALARVTYKMGRYPDALMTLNKVLADEPMFIEAKYYVGLCKSAMGEYQAAIDTFQEAHVALEEWRDKIFHLLVVEYREIEPDNPEIASQLVQDWDELRKELWELRQASARPERDTLEAVVQTYGRAQEFSLDLHLWPELNKAMGDAYLGLKDWSGARNRYRHAMRPREGEGSPDDADAWRRVGDAFFLQGKEIFEEEGLLLGAINQFKAAEGDKLPVLDQGNQQGQNQRGQRGLGGIGGAGGATASQRASQDPEKRFEGYARALYALGLTKDTPIADLTPPPAPDPVIAKIFDGLGNLYLYQANTYATDLDRKIESHTQKEALEQFDKALLFCPTYVPAMLHKAQTHLSHADQTVDQSEKLDGYGQARDLIEQEALALEPSSAALWAELARAYIGLDDLDKAEQAVRKSLSLDKKSVVALNASGLIKYYKGEPVHAANDFEAAIALEPIDFQAYINLGNTFYAMQSWGRAEREYIRALERIPETTIANTSNQRPFVMYLIARTKHQRRLYEKAVETLGEALALRTDFCDAQRLLAASYSGLEQWRAAEEALRSALRNAPRGDRVKTAAIHAHLGQVYETQGRFHEAIAEYAMALSKYPNNVESRFGLERLVAQERRASTPAGS